QLPPPLVKLRSAYATENDQWVPSKTSSLGLYFSRHDQTGMPSRARRKVRHCSAEGTTTVGPGLLFGVASEYRSFPPCNSIVYVWLEKLPIDADNLEGTCANNELAAAAAPTRNR